jgi:hypothetical protein
MATTPTSSFVRDDPATWTALGMRRHLKTGTMGDTFYKAVFGWDDTQLQEATKCANEALERADIKPTETLCRIRFEKGTQLWTQGALKRLGAEADLVAQSLKSDRLFSLPHEKNDWLPPRWFRRDMTFAGREADTVYDFPSITQKFFQWARDQTKESLKRETDAAREATSLEVPSTSMPQTPEHTKKRDVSPLRRPGKTARTSLRGEGSSPSSPDAVHPATSPERSTPQLNNADVHVGWITRQDDSSFILEKDFRSLRAWLVGPPPWNYNYKEIHRSLGTARDPLLQLFWFESTTEEPWVVKSDHSLAGAIERMHSKGKICFLLARDIEHVRTLTPSQRGEYPMILEKRPQ